MADLTTTLASTIASLIGAASPGATTQNIFTAHDTSGATWNASNVFLAGVLNKSCITFKQNPANTFADHATVIGPHTLLCAAHVAPAVGATGYAYKEDGTVVPYTVANPVDQIPGTDICVITTTAAMTGVQVARMLPDSFENYIHNTTAPVYGVYLTQDEKTFCAFTTGSWIAISGLSFTFFSNASDPYFAWYQAQRPGDSSSPWFFIIGGYLCLNEDAFSVNSGDDLNDYVAAIQAIMTLRSGDTITYIDLSPYSTVSDPAIATNPYNGPVVAAGTVTTPIDYVIGYQPGDIDPATAPLTDPSPLSLTLVAPYRFFIRDAGTNGSYASLLSPVNASIFPTGSTVLILPHSSGNLTPGVIAHNATASGGTPVVADVSVVSSTTGPSYLEINGIQVGDPSNTTATFGVVMQAGGVSGGNQQYPTTAKARNILVVNSRKNTATSGILNLTGGWNGAASAENIGFYNSNTSSGASPIVGLNFFGTSPSNITLSQISSYMTNNTAGFMRYQVTAANVGSRLNLTNIIGASTNSAYLFVAANSTVNAGGSLTILASGIRGGTVVLSGFSLGLTSSDIINGMTGALLFANNTTSGLTILTNSSTLVTATTSPVSMDINGANRPTTNGTRSGIVWAGIVNAVVPSLATRF